MIDFAYYRKYIDLKVATSNVTDSDFNDKVVKSQMPVLVDFWAPWCGPCRMAEPVLEELSNAYTGKVEIVKINVDENPNTAQKYSVLSIPTTIMFKGGSPVAKQVGFAGKGAFEDLIKKNL